MIAGRVDLGVRQIGDGAPVAQYEHAVRAFDDLFEFGGDHQNAETLIGELLDQRLDFNLGADVDAARRLVEDEQLGAGAKPTREQDLLLVAAGQIARFLLDARGLDRQPRHEPVDDLRCRASSTMPARVEGEAARA